MMRDYLKNTAQFSGRLAYLLMTETEISNIIKEKSGKDVPPEEIHPLEFLLQQAN
jgi:hypothetical protein